MQISDRNYFTHIGATNEDEMCNFYIMYWIDKGELAKGACWEGDKTFSFANIAKNKHEDASTFEGVYYPPGKGAKPVYQEEKK